MEPHQERVVEEKFHLDEKLEKLKAFSRTNAFGDLLSEEQSRLARQLEAMDMYSEILGERISAF